MAGDIIGTDTPLAAVPASERAQQQGMTAPMPALIVGPAVPGSAHELPPNPTAQNRSATSPDHLSSVRKVGAIQQAALDVEAAFIWLLDVAHALDQKAERWRLLTIFFVAAAATVLTWVDETFDFPVHTLSIVATLAFPLVVFVFAFARLNAFRGEDGTWKLGRGFRRFGDAASDLWQEAIAISALKERVGWVGIAGSVAVAVGVPLSATGLLLKLVQSALSTRAFKDAIGYCDFGGFLAFGGAILLALGVHFARKKAQQQDLLVASPAQQQRLVSAASGLPLVLDANEEGALREAASRVDHRLIREVLLTLAAWHPPRFRDEERYEKELFRELLRVLAASRPERQYRIGGAGRGQWGKVDIAVGESILIEMKHRWKEPDRTIAQVERYAGYWKDRGLVVLLLCGLEGDDAEVARQRLADKFAQLRPTYPCIAIFAARRG